MHLPRLAGDEDAKYLMIIAALTVLMVICYHSVNSGIEKFQKLPNQTVRF